MSNRAVLLLIVLNIIATTSLIVRVWLEKDYGSKPLIVYIVADIILVVSGFLALLLDSLLVQLDYMV